MELAQIDPIKREPVATQVARKLVEYLLSGAVEPGERMPSERQLAEAFGVGRSAMREAIKALSLIGLVEVRQGDGTYLRKADSALLPDVIEWGLLLGERRTMDLVEADVQFHMRLAEASGNLVLRDIHASVQALLRAWIARVLASPESRHPSYLEHVPILDAVIAGDPEAAQRAMASHMSSAAGRLLATLENEASGDRK
jgi:GntR family transcriptional repressor for pyruvate dehydrogenase complex